MDLGTLVGYLGLDTKGFDQGLNDAAGKLDGFAGKAALGGAAIGGAVAAGVFGAMNVEAANDKLAAQLGATGPWAEELGGIAGSLYANAYGANLEEVNVALRGVIQSGAVMEDATTAEIESITAAAMDLAAAFDQDVTATANAAGRMVQQGLAANATEAFDILTRGFQQSANNGGDLIDVVNEYGTTFTELGLNGSQSVGLLDQALKAQIPNADFAADALREMGIIAREGSEEAAEAVESLGLSSADYFAAMQEGGPAAAGALDTVLDALRNTEDPALRAKAAFELVGTQYEDLGDAILQLDPSAATASLGEIEGAVGNLGTTMNDNATANITEFTRQAEQAFVNILGGAVLPVVKDVTGWLSDNFGPALEEIKRIIEEDVVEALKDFDEWLNTNKTTVQTVAGIITVVMLPALIRLGIQAIASGAMTVAGWAMTMGGAIAAGAVYVATSFLIVGRWIAMGVAAIASGIMTVAGWALATASAIAAGLVYIATAALIVGRWVWMGTQALIQAGRMAAAWFIALGPIGWVAGAIIGIALLIYAYWDEIKAKTRAAWEWVVEKVTGAWQWIKDVFMRYHPVGIIISHWEEIKTAVSNGASAVLDYVRGIPGRITGALSGLGSLLYEKGRDLVEGLISGVRSLAGSIGRTFLNLLPSWIRGPFESALGIASPSKVFYGYGAAIGQGLVDGIADMRPAIVSEVGQAAQAILDRWKSGAHMFEDLTWFGNPETVRQHNDVVMDALDAAGVDPMRFDSHFESVLRNIVARETTAGGPRVVYQHDTIVQTTGDPNRIAAAIDARNRDREFLAGVA